MLLEGWVASPPACVGVVDVAVVPWEGRRRGRGLQVEEIRQGEPEKLDELNETVTGWESLSFLENEILVDPANPKK